MKECKGKLRIAIIGHKRIPSREGGVEIVVEELSTRMASRGYDVTCYNRRGHHVSGTEFDSVYTKNYKGVKIKTVFSIEKKGLAAITSSFFAAVRAAFGKYDVVHFHAEGPCAMLWLPKLFGKRCIATIHGLDHQRAKWGKFASWYIRLGEKCAAKYADELIVLSENVQDYFRSIYKRESVFIPNGVHKALPCAAEIITDLYGIKEKEYILYLGRLVPEKGITYLIEAYKQIKTDKKLIIAGGTSDTASYEEQLKRVAMDDARIIFTGFVQGKILAELYSNAYLYVLPSDLEGMPLSLLEAMSYGNCCLTSNIPECLSVIGDFGIAFQKGSIEDLKLKLQKVLDEPETIAIYGQQSKNYISNNYDWEEITERTLNLYWARKKVIFSASMEEE